jgi:5-methylcytosine-specific restriction endonuclease McrA
MTTRRRKLTPAQKAEIVEGQGGLCFACAEPLDDGPDPTEYDHVLARGLGGGEELDNLCAMHRSCHRGADGKTSRDKAMMAKADRCRRYMETGKGRKRKGKPIKSAGFRGWRNFKGEVVRRDD